MSRQTVLPPEILLALRETVRREARALGFARAGFTTANPLAAAVERRWARWRARRVEGRMQWLARERPRRTHPRDLLPKARSAIVVAAGYWQGDHPAPPDGAAGKVARYAWGRDYHQVMQEALRELAAQIDKHARLAGLDGTITNIPCIDSKPLDERALAERAGLGFIGKNTLLIDPRAGSYFLLGVLLTSLELPPDEPARDPAATCGSCRRCIEACPTGALEDAWKLDPRRCISYLTIETRDPFPEELKDRLGGWAFGCDICQQACPINEHPLGPLLAGLEAGAGAGAWISQALLDHARSGKGFERRWGGTPLARPGRKGLQRTLDALAAERSE